MNNSRYLRALALIGAIGLLATACGGGGDAAGNVDISGEPDSSVSGEVDILHAFTGEADVAGLNTIIDAFEEAYPNITVSQQGDNAFESLARTRVNSGQAPDILLHPQPGLLDDFYNEGATFTMTPPDSLEGDLIPGLLDLGSINDDFVAVPLKLSLKSLVWYNVPAFEAGGYTIPETWDEMLAVTEQIAADGGVDAPWCIGIESDDATGWVATDWTEDVLLRAIGPEQYDAWVAGDLAFASDEVQGAINDYIVPIWTNDDYVAGGRDQIARENFGTSVIGITTGEGGECMFHRQATFIEGFIADQAPDAEYGTDYDFFLLPSINEEFGKPALGGGDFAALYSDNPAAAEFMKFLTTATAGEGWAQMGGFLSPFTTFDSSLYPTESARTSGELLASADSFRFDGSDLMPTDVGASSADGSFWNEMTAWITGQTELDAALQAIDATYASVKQDGGASEGATEDATE
ncbi:MAG: ABC transporter substrate-binding protein [Euzebya sp.]